MAKSTSISNSQKVVETQQETASNGKTFKLTESIIAKIILGFMLITMLFSATTPFLKFKLEDLGVVSELEFRVSPVQAIEAALSTDNEYEDIIDDITTSLQGLPQDVLTRYANGFATTEDIDLINQRLSKINIMKILFIRQVAAPFQSNDGNKIVMVNNEPSSLFFGYLYAFLAVCYIALPIIFLILLLCSLSKKWKHKLKFIYSYFAIAFILNALLILITSASAFPLSAGDMVFYQLGSLIFYALLIAVYNRLKIGNGEHENIFGVTYKPMYVPSFVMKCVSLALSCAMILASFSGVLSLGLELEAQSSITNMPRPYHETQEIKSLEGISVLDYWIIYRDLVKVKMDPYDSTIQQHFSDIQTQYATSDRTVPQNSLLNMMLSKEMPVQIPVIMLTVSIIYLVLITAIIMGLYPLVTQLMKNDIKKSKLSITKTIMLFASAIAVLITALMCAVLFNIEIYNLRLEDKIFLSITPGLVFIVIFAIADFIMMFLTRYEKKQLTQASQPNPYLEEFAKAQQQQPQQQQPQQQVPPQA